MNLRREFEKLIERKKLEIVEAQRSIASAEAYIQAMTDAIKKLPKEIPTPVVREGSEVGRIRDLIVSLGRPLHLNEIIEGLGRTADPDAKAKIAGLLGWYTSKSKVFIKTAPNTYGIASNEPSPSSGGVNLPDDFGAGPSSEGDHASVEDF